MLPPRVEALDSRAVFIALESGQIACARSVVSSRSARRLRRSSGTRKCPDRSATPRLSADNGFALSVLVAVLRSRALSPIALHVDVSGLVRTGEAEAPMDQDFHHTDCFGKMILAVRGPFGQPDHCRRAAEKDTGSRRIEWKRQLPGHVRRREEILQIRFADIVGPCRVNVLWFARRQRYVSIGRETSLEHPVHFQIGEVDTTRPQVTTATFPR